MKLATGEYIPFEYCHETGLYWMKIRKASPKAVLLATERLETRVAERVSSMRRGDTQTDTDTNNGAYLHFVAMLADKELGRVAEPPTVDDNEDVHAAHCNAAPGACNPCASSAHKAVDATNND
eukprot:1293839-Rhodomonas_salina.1